MSMITPILQMRKSKLRGVHRLTQISWEILLSANSVLPTVSHVSPTPASVDLCPSFSMASIQSFISSGFSTPLIQEQILPGIRFWIVVTLRLFNGKFLEDSGEACL